MIQKVLVLFFSLLGVFPLQAQVSDPRLQAMGDLRLVLTGEWNQLDLFAAGGNPAWLHERGTKDWLRVFSDNDFTRGEFRRHYDPRKRNFAAISFTGVKRLDENQTVLGQITYFTDQLLGMPFALEREPYAADPFILADTSTAGYHFWGPEISGTYSRRISRTINFGVRLNYTLDMAVRDRESRVKITQRKLGTVLAMCWKIIPSLTGGLTYSYENLFDLTQVPRRQDGREPVTYRYRGYLVARRELKVYPRNSLTTSHHIENQWQIGLGAIHCVMQGGYRFQSTDIFDGSSIRFYEAYWQRIAWNFDFFVGYSRPGTPLTLAAFAHLITASDWSRHHRLPVVITEQNTTRYEYGLGLGYQPRPLNYRIGFEISFSRFQAVFSDYIGHKRYTPELFRPEIRVGGEYFVRKNLSLQGGFQWQDYHLQGDIPYLIDSHHFPRIQTGVTLWQQKFMLGLYADWGIKLPKGNIPGVRTHFNIRLNGEFNLQ